ncbi:MAG: SPFH domain-containing protein [Cyanobacteria bacterium J06641_5]
MEAIFALVALSIVGWTTRGSFKIVQTQNEALVEYLGAYKRKLAPGLNFLIPFVEKIVFEETNREKVIDIPPQRCVTRDNVSIEVDAVIYWRIMDMERAFYRVEDLRVAMENLVLTQVRAEMGQLELDQTFTARTEVNETLLRELDIATDPWGVKVTRVELRDINPSKDVRDSMELQMAAERRKRAAILTSEGEKESTINEARGQAEAQVLDAEARKRATVLDAEAKQQAILLRAEAERQEQVLRARATAEAMDIVTEKLNSGPNAHESLQFILAQDYLEMGKTIGNSESSKILFMDPRSMFSTLEGARAVLGDEALLDDRPR